MSVSASKRWIGYPSSTGRVNMVPKPWDSTG